MKNIVILISGRGSNMEAIVRAQIPSAKIAAVISNRPDAAGLAFADREAFDGALIEAIDAYQADLVILAGFMRILTPGFVTHYTGRLLNIHPSLLPKYKGLHTHQRALEAGDAEHGCSVHFVTEELDGGPLVVQAVVPVMADDTPETLAERVHAAEHQIYPLAMHWFAQGRLQLDESGCQLDGQLLPASGQVIRTF